MLKEIIMEALELSEKNRFETCPEGKKRVGKKCVTLTADEKKAKKIAAIKAAKQRKKDAILKAKLSCKDGAEKVKVNGKFKCIVKKECPKGARFNALLKKCVKTKVQA